MEIVGYYTNNACMAGAPPSLCDPDITHYEVADENGDLYIIPPPFDPLQVELYGFPLHTAPSEIQPLLNLILEDDALGAAEDLAKIKGGSFYFRLLIQEGTYRQFCLAAKFLAESPLTEADTTIIKMIEDGAPSEKAVAMTILADRAAEQKTNIPNPAEILFPFLESDDPLLELGAIVALIRLGAKDELRAFAEKRQGTPIEKRINHLLDYRFNFSIFALSWLHKHQTAFFRYPSILAKLANDAKSYTGQKYTVWDIGCSVGLSTQSIQITSPNAQVIGTDISPLALIYAERRSFSLSARPLASYGNPAVAYQTEMQLLQSYAFLQGLDADKIVRENFTIQDGSYPPLYMVNSNNPPTFAFDDIASPVSIVADASVNAAVYTNVHYQLSPAEQRQAIQKIKQKLVLGGKVFVLDPDQETYAEFEATFGEPTMTGTTLSIYVKREAK
ncbi:MAG: hypothetical protein HQ596_06350 [Candidatus Saganbacteria bacterium]|nr:hypothetical protein [Candidatus Saganbacteria bacterium]